MVKPSRSVLEGQNERWTEFKRAHPGVARALEVFQISQEQYERALGAMYGPRVTTSNSTVTPTLGVNQAHEDMD